MQEQPFSAWLRDVRQQAESSVATRVSDCRLVERHEGDLDAHWKADGLRGLLDRLTYSREDERRGRSPEHNVPTKGDLYGNSATFKGAVNLYRKFLDAGEDTGAGGSDASRERWDRYLEEVRRYADGDQLQTAVEYKLGLAAVLAKARDAVLQNDPDWARTLDDALQEDTDAEHYVVFHVNRAKFLKWKDAEPEAARIALRDLWDTGVPAPERVRAFSRRLPWGAETPPEQRRMDWRYTDLGIDGPWSRLAVMAALLMATDARRHPPLAKRFMLHAYRRGELQASNRAEDEGAEYERAMSFFDKLIDEARKKGIDHPRDRLEAQTIVRAIHKADSLDGQDDKRAEDSDADRERWDRYLEDVRRYVESGRLDSEEVNFKLRIGDALQQARQAALTNRSDWPDLVKAATQGKWHPMAWRAASNLRQWIDDAPDNALQALRALWTEDDRSTSERVRGFSTLYPWESKGGGVPPEGMRHARYGTNGRGTRLRTISVLLMGLNASRYPPFMRSVFDSVYGRLGIEVLSGETAEEVQYEHALGFLDELIRRTTKHGLKRPSTRLEAQSVVWALMGGEGNEGPPERPAVPESQPCIGEASEPLARADFSELADELLYDEARLRTIARLLDDKRQVIFQGPPGTGKTYAARALARFLAESDERVTLVQFHPSYAYEDFVQGYRPTLTEEGQAGFALRDGPLVQTARRAKDQPSSPHFLIIDEINRGNLAKVFGELYFLLEYRDEDMTLQYAGDRDDERFSLPENLYIIGTMNTADRSIALVDLALRRRFHFVEFHPDKPPVAGLLERWLRRNAEDMAWVVDLVKQANANLDDRQAAIGPTYFMKEDLDEEKVRLIWEHNVLPYVEEHLYGETDRLAEFELDKLRHQTESADAAAASQSPEAPGESDDAEQEEEAGDEEP